MNDQSQMMNQHQMMNQLQNQSQMMNQQAPQMGPSQGQMVNQLNHQPLMVGQGSNPFMGQNYGQWPQPRPNMPPPVNSMKFPNPMNQMYGGIVKPPGRSTNWKGKKPMDKRKDMRRKDKLLPTGGGGGVGGGGGLAGLATTGLGAGGGGYQPPTLYELEQQNRLKARRFYPNKRKFNRMGPYAHAPRNTTSFLIRAKKSGGIASLVSPCPVTPAVLPTPVFSPSKEALVDMAKEEWGVDGYGSMKGLIRLRSPGHDETVDDYEDEDEGGSSESDVEEHVEVERRLDHDLSRFEMIYPNSGADYHNVLENRVDDQDTHIAQLEEENLILKERLYLMERELGDLRRRLVCLERQNQVVEDVNEEFVENVSENDSEGVRSIHVLSNKHNEEVNSVPRNRDGESGARMDNSEETLRKELKELAVQEVFHGEAMKSNSGGIEFKESKPDNELFKEGLGFNLIVQNEGAKHDEEQVGESENNEDISSFKVDSVDEGLKGQPAGDVRMEEILSDKMNEKGESKQAGNEGIGMDLNHHEVLTEAKEEGSNNALDNEATGDMFMGDALATDKEV